ncbi:RecQ family ATP-dependent DNA helicase [Candidatus Enterococcus mangumiae]|uniref:ATP-dependent DNA helicase RecQ n=1 Tax=Candidatus Enterococcus mangumiae TaxID=2230878 RepID=A0ABZ2SYD4_9ENTE|nr:RecQ family ATP-dependent DNA helicase [Enterococcus sp. DIV1094]MBO0491292.1 ATP-dependent DNA helicase RecQ [Enterococcus sp. DIV1094]
MELVDPLKQYFGFSSFRPGQEEIISTLLNQKDVLAILPTGNGKSLCYQLTGYLQEGLVLIVSPLLSLMEDQVGQLQKRGEKRVIAYNSLLSKSEKKYVLAHLFEYKFVFVSPEMLNQSELLYALKQQKIALYVIDEAHCVSQWGIDFRPEYQSLGRIGKELGSPTTLALTATATLPVQQEIENILFQTKPVVVKHSVNRENIALFVSQTEEKEQQLRQLMAQADGAMIIYCATKKEVERLYQLFRKDYAVGYYHGGLDASQRRQLQQQFSKNQLRFLFATNAFGMGIDKADIRYVVHYDLPDSLENYMQEIGRAGRDQRPSSAVLLYKPGDEGIHYFFQQLSKEQRQIFEEHLLAGQSDATHFDEIQQKWLTVVNEMQSPDVWLRELKKQEKVKIKQLQEMLAYIHETGCRRERLLSYFGETLKDKTKNCCDRDGALFIQSETRQTSPIAEAGDWQTILLNLF